MTSDNIEKRQRIAKVIKDFRTACKQSKQNSYAYEAGWWSATVCRLLMTVPPDELEQELAILISETRQIEAVSIMAALTG